MPEALEGRFGSSRAAIRRDWAIVAMLRCGSDELSHAHLGSVTTSVPAPASAAQNRGEAASEGRCGDRTLQAVPAALALVRRGDPAGRPYGCVDRGVLSAARGRSPSVGVRKRLIDGGRSLGETFALQAGGQFSAKISSIDCASSTRSTQISSCSCVACDRRRVTSSGSGPKRRLSCR